MLTLSALLQNSTTLFLDFTSKNRFTESYYQTIIQIFQTSDQSILAFSEGFYKIMLHTFSEFISNNYENYQKILPLPEFISTNTNIFKEMSNQGTFKESDKTEKSRKIRKIRSRGNLVC